MIIISLDAAYTGALWSVSRPLAPWWPGTMCPWKISMTQHGRSLSRCGMGI